MNYSAQAAVAAAVLRHHLSALTGRPVHLGRGSTHPIVGTKSNPKDFPPYVTQFRSSGSAGHLTAADSAHPATHPRARDTRRVEPSRSAAFHHFPWLLLFPVPYVTRRHQPASLGACASQHLRETRFSSNKRPVSRASRKTR